MAKPGPFRRPKSQPPTSHPSPQPQAGLKVEQQFYSGPLPAPEILERFEGVYPGAAKIVFDTYQLQVTGRNRREDALVHGKVSGDKRGQVLSFVLATLCLGLGFFFGFKGMETASIIAIITAVAPIILATVTGLLKK
jgi:hypothetical protein